VISYDYLSSNSSADGIAAYLESARAVDDVAGYYQTGSAPSEWLGSGAAHLNLSGPVSTRDLAEMLSGRLPDGADLSQRGNRGAQRRKGADLTISAPKSVSMVSLMLGDVGLLEAHDRAVREAVAYIESDMVFARIGKGGAAIERTGSVVAAAYRHEDARPVDGRSDADLHTHVVLVNATRRQDGAWAALNLDFGKHNEKLYLLDAIYKAALARGVRALGYGVELTTDGFEITGISRAQIEACSRRRAEIDGKLAEQGLDRDSAGALTKQRANKVTRAEKVHLGEINQRYQWRTDARAIGLYLSAIQAAGRLKAESGISADAAVESGAAHLSERKSVFSSAQLKREALMAGMGSVSLADIEASIARRVGGLVGDEDARQDTVFTTRGAIEVEQRVLESAQAGRGRAAPLVPASEISRVVGAREAKQGFLFGRGQRQAVSDALQSRDRHFAIVGAAGSGKTTSLAAIVEQARVNGYEIVGVAPSKQAARELRRSGCDQTMTLEKALLRDQGNLDGKRLYLLDEAGMVSSVDMDRLIRRAEEENARTILVGDPRQLASVQAGSPFQQLIDTKSVEVARIDEIQRQTDPALREIAQRFARGDAIGAVKAAQPFMTEVAHDDMAGAAAASYLKLSPHERADTLVLAGTNLMRRVVNQTIRDRLINIGANKGGIGGDAVMIKSMAATDFTREQARQYKHYERGMIVQFRRDIKQNKKLVAERGSQWAIVGRDDVGLRLKSGDGREMSWKPTDSGASVFVQSEIALAVGDRVVFRVNDKAAGVDNGQAATVCAIDARNGSVTVTLETGDELRLGPDRAYALDYAYCRTIHSAQGATVARAIVVGESGRVATAETAYVAASRETSGLEIITDNIARLSKAWATWSERAAASSVLTGKADRPEIRLVRGEISAAQAAAREDPTIKAERLAARWKEVEDDYDKLDSSKRYLEQKEEWKAVKARMNEITSEIGKDPQMDAVLWARRKEFGIGERRPLGEALRNSAAVIALEGELKPRPSPSPGMSM
jgi:conjugative relaxase-like TrwC/TraI family protein